MRSRRPGGTLVPIIVRVRVRAPATLTALALLAACGASCNPYALIPPPKDPPNLYVYCAPARASLRVEHGDHRCSEASFIVSTDACTVAVEPGSHPGNLEHQTYDDRGIRVLESDTELRYILTQHNQSATCSYSGAHEGISCARALCRSLRLGHVR